MKKNICKRVRRNFQNEKNLWQATTKLSQENKKYRDMFKEINDKSAVILVQANEFLSELQKDEVTDQQEIKISNDLPERCRMILSSLRTREIEENLMVDSQASFEDTSKDLRKNLNELESKQGKEKMLIKTLHDSLILLKEKFGKKETKDEEVECNFDKDIEYSNNKIKENNERYEKIISDLEHFLTYDTLSLKNRFQKELIDILDNLYLKVIIESKHPIKSFECKKEKHKETYYQKFEGNLKQLNEMLASIILNADSSKLEGVSRNEFDHFPSIAKQKKLKHVETESPFKLYQTNEDTVSTKGQKMQNLKEQTTNKNILTLPKSFTHGKLTNPIQEKASQKKFTTNLKNLTVDEKSNLYDLSSTSKNICPPSIKTTLGNSKYSIHAFTKKDQSKLLKDSKSNEGNTKLVYPIEFKVSLDICKMTQFNFDLFTPLSQGLTMEELHTYREIRYLKWMRPEFSSASLNINSLVEQTTNAVAKKKDVSLMLSEWLNIFRDLYLNYKLIKNIFLSYNMMNSNSFEDIFLMKYSTFEILCKDIDLRVDIQDLLENFFISSRFDKNVENLKADITTNNKIKTPWKDYLDDLLRSSKNDFSLNLPSFIECIVRVSKINSEKLCSKELISESLHRILVSYLIPFARRSPSQIYDLIYDEFQVAKIMKDYAPNLNKIFEKYKIKIYSHFESLIHRTNGSMTIKELGDFLRQERLLKPLLDSKKEILSQKKSFNILGGVKSLIIINNLNLGIEYSQIFRSNNEFNKTDEIKLDQNQIVDMFLYCLDDTRGYIKIKEKVNESDLKIQYPEYAKLVAFFGIRQWATCKKFENTPFAEAFSEYMYGILETMGFQGEKKAGTEKITNPTS